MIGIADALRRKEFGAIKRASTWKNIVSCVLARFILVKKGLEPIEDFNILKRHQFPFCIHVALSNLTKSSHLLKASFMESTLKVANKFNIQETACGV